jgi:acetate kinase
MDRAKDRDQNFSAGSEAKVVGARSAGHSRILTINGGSSSLKFALFEQAEPCARRLFGQIDRIGLKEARWRVTRAGAEHPEERPVEAPDQNAAVRLVLDWLDHSGEFAQIALVGHRIVHGGSRYHQPERITAELLEELRRIRALDPEHLPGEIELIEAFQRRAANLPQIACFDTAFHHDMPRVAQQVPIPRRFEAAGVRRYGFHGLSYAYLLKELVRVAPGEERGRLVLAHLGAGASLAAVYEGRSIDTTMGFTPASGLVMGTRTGDLDPGLVRFLAQSEGMSAERFDRLVNHESGLLGVSETSSDVRDLLAREKDDVRAAEALNLFCYQAKKGIGAFAAALGGVDTLVFAGGIGENAPEIRRRICAGLGFLGVAVDERRNAANAPLISTDLGRVKVRVLRTDEEMMIAQAAARLMAQAS